MQLCSRHNIPHDVIMITCSKRQDQFSSSGPRLSPGSYYRFLWPALTKPINIISNRIEACLEVRWQAGFEGFTCTTDIGKHGIEHIFHIVEDAFEPMAIRCHGPHQVFPAHFSILLNAEFLADHVDCAVKKAGSACGLALRNQFNQVVAGWLRINPMRSTLRSRRRGP